MNKRLKSILITIIVICILVIAVLLIKISSRLPENPPDYTGNSAGNIYNRGLFAEDDTFIYFANLADNFRLYRATHDLENIECIHSDSVEYLNPDSESHFIYYSRINYRQNTSGNNVFDIFDTGIYRLQLKNEALTRLYQNACGAVLLGGNTLFYQTYGADGDFDLYSLSVNSEDEKATLLSSDYFTPACFTDGYLYYGGVTDDHSLYALLPETGSTSRVAEIDCYQPIVTSAGTYFLSQSHDYSLFYLPNTSDTATLIANERISAYNLSTDGRTLFYQVDDGKNNRLCRYDISSQTVTELLSGNYKNLNTVSDYLFFTDFEENVCNGYDISSGRLFTFMPSPESNEK